MISRFAKRVRDFSLIPVVCVTLFLAACASVLRIAAPGTSFTSQVLRIAGIRVPVGS